jgi:hypothetical protein
MGFMIGVMRSLEFSSEEETDKSSPLPDEMWEEIEDTIGPGMDVEMWELHE